jgi:hypothetical protein
MAETTIKLNQKSRKVITRMLENLGETEVRDKIKRHDPMEPMPVTEDNLRVLKKASSPKLVQSDSVEWKNARMRIVERYRSCQDSNDN